MKISFIRPAQLPPGAVNFFQTCITIDRDEFEIVREFCYLGNVIGQAGGCTDALTACIGSAWKAFHELLPILTNKSISLVNCGKVFKACVHYFSLFLKEQCASFNVLISNKLL